MAWVANSQVFGESVPTGKSTVVLYQQGPCSLQKAQSRPLVCPAVINTPPFRPSGPLSLTHLTTTTPTKSVSPVPPYCHFLVSSQIASFHSCFPAGSKPSLPQPQPPNSSSPFPFFQSMTLLQPMRSVQEASLVSSSSFFHDPHCS